MNGIMFMRSSKFLFFKSIVSTFQFHFDFSQSYNAWELYVKYKLYFINPKIHEVISERNALKLIKNTLSLHGFSIQDFGLPYIFNEFMVYNDDIQDDISSGGSKNVLSPLGAYERSISTRRVRTSYLRLERKNFLSRLGA